MPRASFIAIPPREGSRVDNLLCGTKRRKMPSDQLALELSPTFDFSIISRDIPSPGPGQLLVKVTATALNAGDWKVHKFGILIGDSPAQAGMDAAGIVESVGQGVEDFRKGERV